MPVRRARLVFDLGLGAGVAVALFALADPYDHALSVSLRTLREDDASVVFFAVVAFAVVTLLGTADRPSRLAMGLPAVVMVSSLVVGWLAWSARARLASPSLTMAQQSDALMVAMVHRAAFLVVGAFAAAVLLGLSAVAHASRSRMGPEYRRSWLRRLAMLAAFAVGIAVAAWLSARFGLFPWWGAPACSMGVLAILFAAPGERGDTRLPETEEQLLERLRASGAALAGACSAVGAVLCSALAAGAAASVRLGAPDASPETWDAELAGAGHRFLLAASATLVFAAPVGLAMVAALSRRDWQARRGARSAVLGAVVTLLLSAGIPLSLGRSSEAVLSLAPSVPGGITLPILPGDDTRALPEDRVLYFGKQRLSRGHVDLGATTQLDDPAGCDSFVRREVAGVDDIWMGLDTGSSFRELACLLRSLEQTRSGQPGPRRDRLGRLGSSPCTVHWLTRTPGGALSVVDLSLGHTACFDPPWPELDIEPEKIFEVVLVGDGKVTIRLMAGAIVVYEQPVSGPLGPALEHEWKSAGSHISPMDRKFDRALIRAPAETSLPEIVATVLAIRSVERTENRMGTDVIVPAFDVGLTLPRAAPEPKLGDDQALALDVAAAPPSSLRRALSVCARKPCSPSARARLWLHLGDALASAGDRAGAEDAYFVALATDPGVRGEDGAAFAVATSRPRARLALSSPAKTSAPDWTATVHILEGQLGALAACVAEADLAGVPVPPILQLAWNVSTTGEVRAWTEQEKPLQVHLSSCVIGAVQALSFPPSKQFRQYRAIVHVDR